MVAGLAVLAIVVASAAASAPPSGTGAPPVHVKREIVLRPAARLAPSSTGAGGGFFPTEPLVYGGGPVMHSITVHLVFYDPSSGCSPEREFCAFPIDFAPAVEQYIQDLGSDSGKTTNAFAALPQYSDSGGPALYDVAYGGYFDLGAVPRTAAVTDDFVQSELSTAIFGKGWPTGLSNLFLFVLPPGTTSCFDSSDEVCSTNAYCAYHFSTTGNTIYGVIPWETTACHEGPANVVEPQPTGDADISIGLMSAVISGTATDPLGDGWADAEGEDAGGKCFASYGSQIGANDNTLMATHPYEVPTVWSNAIGDCFQVGAPTISAVSPAGGGPGDSIGIDGSNFVATYPAKPTVSFNGIAAASVTVDSATHLTVTVPAGHTTGKITVAGLGGSGTSAQTFFAVPTISGFTPGQGGIRATVTVNGSGLTGATHVALGGTSAAFTVVSDSKLTFTVPAGAVTGTISVTNPAGVATAVGSYTVLPPPTITSLSPGSGPVGTPVTITGTNLQGTVGVQIGSIVTVPTSVSAMSVTFAIPPGAPSGAIRILATSGSATSIDTFTVTG